ISTTLYHCCFILFFFYCYGAPRDLHSFPTRRSSDLPERRRRLPVGVVLRDHVVQSRVGHRRRERRVDVLDVVRAPAGLAAEVDRSEEHTSELQSLRHLVCRLLLEKKNKYNEDKVSNS